MCNAIGNQLHLGTRWCRASPHQRGRGASRRAVTHRGGAFRPSYRCAVDARCGTRSKANAAGRNLCGRGLTARPMAASPKSIAGKSRALPSARAPANPAAGVRLLRTVGDVVSRGEPLYEIHAATEAQLGFACAYTDSHLQIIRFGSDFMPLKDSCARIYGVRPYFSIFA
jgi:hypothetical protein